MRFNSKVGLVFVVSLIVGLLFLSLTSKKDSQPNQGLNQRLKTFSLPKLTRSEVKAISEVEGLQSIEERSLIVISLKYFNYSGNFLVWGTGKDTPFWERINLGRNTYLEYKQEWIKFGNEHSSDVQQVSYRTEARKYKTYKASDNSLGMVLSRDVRKESWDVILVDSPNGLVTKRKLNPGRMQPIYMCSKLANNRTHICIHDCNREVEVYWGEKMFRKSHKKHCIGRMCCYYPQHVTSI